MTTMKLARFSLASMLLLVSFSAVTAIWGFGGFPKKLPEIRLPGFNPPVLKRPPPTRAPTSRPAFAPMKDSRYCDESEINKILAGGGRRKRAVLWPVDCKYPSIVKYQNSYQFMYEIYSCCNACNFPTFTKCVDKHGSPNWRCPTDGIHCIVNCVHKYGPGTILKKTKVKPSTGGGFVGLGMGHGLSSVTNLGKGKEIFTKVDKKLKCEKEETLPNGKKCIRRLCVPLNEL